MLLKIISPVAEVLSAEVESVELPGTKGRFEVLQGHAALISSLERGKIVYKVRGKVESVAVNSGFVEVSDNVITVCIE